MAKTYKCTNSACSLGTAGKPGGLFSGGATKDQIALLTGDRDPKDHGNGVCPNCGKRGKETK